MMHRLARSMPPGVLAAGPALLAVLVGATLLGGPGAIDVIADGALRAVPLPVFEAVLGALGPLAKGILYLAVAAGAVLAGWLLGAALGRVAGPLSGRVAPRAALAAAAALVVAELGVLPLAGAGLLGTAATGPMAALQVPLVVACLLFGATFALVEPLHSWQGATPAPAGSGPGRPAGERLDGAQAAATTGPASAEPAASGSATTGPAVADGPGEAAKPAASATAASLAPEAVPRQAAPAPGLPRRSFLAAGLALAALAASGVVAVGRVATAAGSLRSAPRAPAAGGFGPTPAITPIGDHYVVAKGLIPPSVDGAAWRLAVGGLVGRPVELSLDELKALGSSADVRTLLCISNPVVQFGAWAGTQAWTGTTVAAVLGAARGPLPGASHVLWTSADGYTESSPLDVALDPRSLLAWGMGEGGAPLPAEHGFPLRVLLPGRYGMKQPKWLTGITLAAEPLDGYWEQRGWDREAIVRTWSRIDDPRDGDTVAAGQALPTFGVAFAGERGIRSVEVSGDGGVTWVAAELEDPSAALAWVRWRATLAAPRVGPHLLRVRATDGTGAIQPEVPEPPLPRGAAGWQEVRIIAG